MNTYKLQGKTKQIMSSFSTEKRTRGNTHIRDILTDSSYTYTRTNVNRIRPRSATLRSIVYVRRITFNWKSLFFCRR